MNNAEHISLANLDFSNLDWIHDEGGPQYDYNVDYWTAFLGANLEAGTVDFLTKWAPNAYCPLHRHLGHTTTLVLQGEHHAIDMDDPDQAHTIRHPGSYSQKQAGDLHMEYAGPEGAILYFSMQAVDGKLFQMMQGDEVVSESPIEVFVKNMGGTANIG